MNARIETKNAWGLLVGASLDLPADLRGVAPSGLPYSPWQLIEHTSEHTFDTTRPTPTPQPEMPGKFSGEPASSDNPWMDALVLGRHLITKSMLPDAEQEPAGGWPEIKEKKKDWPGL